MYAASVRAAAPVASSAGVPDATSASHQDALLLVMNSVAIWLRNRYEQKW